MVRTRLPREPEERKGSKEPGRGGKKRRGHVGSPMGLESDEESCGGGEEDDEGLETLGVPLNSVVKARSWPCRC